MPFKWNLRMVMATRNIWTGVELKRILEEKSGLNISSAGISRLLNEEQTEIKLAVLDALCNALECGPNELLVQTVVNTSIEEEDQRNA